MCVLTRDQFQKAVFERDSFRCLMCDEPAKDAHHIIERRLWDDAGYYVDNGASLCAKHHILAEQTNITCEELRLKANIQKVVLPAHLSDFQYDKWGNIIFPTGMRLKGELFFDDSVQKILKEGNVLQFFSEYVKYPRTLHLPWSPGFTKDDVVLKSTDHFKGKRIVITLKMDGENSSIYRNYFHARSINSDDHPSQHWLKNYCSRFQFDIPEQWRICGENLFAKHSIFYQNLKDYFLVFSIWNEKNQCLSWEETKFWAELLNLKTVPVLYEGIWDEELIKNLHKTERDGNICEGYVVRFIDQIDYKDFRRSYAKYVRKDHVDKSRHNWKMERITQNELKRV